MTNAANPTVGKAVYLEFYKAGATTQVILLPEGQSTSHRTVPATMMRRKLSVAAPRKTWKIFSASVTATNAWATATPDARRLDMVGSSVLSFSVPLLSGLQRADWKLRKDPIFVEVTAEDLELARMSKTPHKVIGRILRARKALGFPDEVIEPAF